MLNLNPQPQIDVLDLRVDISEVELNVSFTKIARGLWFVVYPINNVLFSNFGADSALSEGINLRYNGKPLFPEAIKRGFDFWKYAFDVDDPQDATAVTKLNIISSRLTFAKFVRGGLKMGGKNEFKVMIQDDLSSSANTEIKLILEGEL